MPDFHEHQPVRTIRRVGEIAPGERGVIVHAYAIGDAYEVDLAPTEPTSAPSPQDAGSPLSDLARPSGARAIRPLVG